jgi:peptidoglycan/xylan/chitin deacetylase (PgdA/CDA1 family)
VSGRPWRGPTVVNLCFHGIGTPERDLEPDEDRYWVTEGQFAELLQVAGREPRIRITFDDGNASDAEIALPALQRAGLSAAFFVIAGRIGEPGSLTAAQVRELAAAGMTIGSHGFGHRSWRSLDPSALDQELVEAPAAIAEAAGRPVDEASCPFGEYDRRLLGGLRERGFRRVYTVDEAPADPDAWLQARYTIRSTDTAAGLERLAQSARKEPVALLRTAVKRWR